MEKNSKSGRAKASLKCKEANVICAKFMEKNRIPEDIREHIYKGKLQIILNTTIERGKDIVNEFSVQGYSFILIDDEFEIIISIDADDWIVLDGICQKYGTPYTL